jgi:hypothetical protein
VSRCAPSERSESGGTSLISDWYPSHGAEVFKMRSGAVSRRAPYERSEVGGINGNEGTDLSPYRVRMVCTVAESGFNYVLKYILKYVLKTKTVTTSRFSGQVVPLSGKQIHFIVRVSSFNRLLLN